MQRVLPYVMIIGLVLFGWHARVGYDYASAIYIKAAAYDAQGCEEMSLLTEQVKKSVMKINPH